MELQGGELSANEMLGHGSESAKSSPFWDMLWQGERGFPSLPTATKSIRSSHFLYCTPTWELHRCSSSQPLKPRLIPPVYSTPKAELPQLKPSFLSRLEATTQLVKTRCTLLTGLQKLRYRAAHLTPVRQHTHTIHSSDSFWGTWNLLTESHSAPHYKFIYSTDHPKSSVQKSPQQVGRFQLDWQDL